VFGFTGPELVLIAGVVAVAVGPRLVELWRKL
jgi:hypothetical protein